MGHILRGSVWRRDVVRRLDLGVDVVAHGRPRPLSLHGRHYGAWLRRSADANADAVYVCDADCITKPDDVADGVADGVENANGIADTDEYLVAGTHALDNRVADAEPNALCDPDADAVAEWDCQRVPERYAARLAFNVRHWLVCEQ